MYTQMAKQNIVMPTECNYIKSFFIKICEYGLSDLCTMMFMSMFV